MNRREIMATPFSEFLDLLKCEAIFNGAAIEKNTADKNTEEKAQTLPLWEAAALYR